MAGPRRGDPVRAQANTISKSYKGTEPACQAVLGIIDNLLDRRKTKKALNQFGRDVREEMIETLSQIVATSHRQDDRRNRDRV